MDVVALVRAPPRRGVRYSLSRVLFRCRRVGRRRIGSLLSMTDRVEEDRLAEVGFEPVYIELDWYDGPQAGLANVAGAPHYFHTVHYAAGDGEPDDEYFVWPAGKATLAWEREQWAIFVDWNTRYEAGVATPGSHPGHGGVDARYDELTALLGPHRLVPVGARRLAAVINLGHHHEVTEAGELEREATDRRCLLENLRMEHKARIAARRAAGLGRSINVGPHRPG